MVVNYFTDEIIKAVNKFNFLSIQLLIQINSSAICSVGKGVDCFKQDRHVEAMQHFNIALDVDPKCVEGLVARGAL